MFRCLLVGVLLFAFTSFSVLAQTQSQVTAYAPATPSVQSLGFATGSQIAQTAGAALSGPTPMAQSTAASDISPGVLTLFAERDRQYQQRFDSQEKAAAIAFAAQEKAVAAALAANKEATAAAFAAAKEAVDKAEIANQKHFDSVNEFRKTLTDQAGLFVTKTEVDIRIKAITDKLDDLGKRMDLSTGRSAGIDWLFYILMAVGGLVIGIAAMMFRGRTPRLG